ncbi:MAG: hypothetical protein HY700_18170 [Gemmatimonadetes bacterium]|nr:hypothetical protein [Gemmatimonadota bacterium]
MRWSTFFPRSVTQSAVWRSLRRAKADGPRFTLARLGPAALASLVARHYPERTRPLLTYEGMPQVLRTGVLRAALPLPDRRAAATIP